MKEYGRIRKKQIKARSINKKRRREEEEEEEIKKAEKPTKKFWIEMFNLSYILCVELI